MPFISTEEVEDELSLTTVQATLDALLLRFSQFESSRPVTTSSGKGVNFRQNGKDFRTWWPRPSENELGYPSQWGWAGAWGLNKDKQAFQDPCTLTVQQLHELFLAISDQHYKRK